MGLPAYKLPEEAEVSTLHPTYVPLETYLLLEAQAETKHEYDAYSGEIVAMAGAEPIHNEINYNLNQALGPHLRRRGCKGYMGDQRVQTPNDSGYLYPDTVVACGPTFSERGRPRSLTNPVFIAEVLSGSTSSRDRGVKFLLYRQIPSLQQYLILDSESVHAELFSRDELGRWVLTETTDPAAVLDLSSLGAALPLTDVYAGVELSTF